MKYGNGSIHARLRRSEIGKGYEDLCNILADKAKKAINFEELFSAAAARIAELEADNAQRRLDYTNSVNRLDARIAELEAQLAAAQKKNAELEIICKSLGSRVAAAKRMAEEERDE